tara:strand:- start:146 stop:628 length:483 start_codon:yes stop_codon:yes gene_type:complete
MNQVFAGGFVLIIALMLWSSKKQSKLSIFFKSQKNSFLQPQETYSLIAKKKLIHNEYTKELNNQKTRVFPTYNFLNSIEKKKELTKLISSHPDDRLLAIQIASQWNNQKSIPFLRRGLKDSDRRVVIAAAAAISSYKGNKINKKEKHQSAHLPRNVSLMR